MPNKIEFVNRRKEIEEIVDLACGTETNSVLLIEGSGGIGKTRLLDQISTELENVKNIGFFIPDVIDFDDPILRTDSGIELRLIRLLDQNSSSLILKAMNELWQMEKRGDSPESLKAQKKRIDVLLAGRLTGSDPTRRIVLRFDTLEKLDAKTLFPLLDFIKHLNNAICIFAGRPSIDLCAALQTRFGKHFHTFELEPFDESASKEYLERRQVVHNTFIGPRLIEIISFLSNGKPIIMDLAIDYVTHEISLHDLLKINVADVKERSEAEKSIYFRKFEEDLIRRIIELRDPMDRLALAMSRVYPLTKSMIAQLLGLSQTKSEELFDKAKEFVFIKYLISSQEITLHDEMRRLIGEYVWKEIDGDGYRRNRDSTIAKNIYESIEQDIKKQIKTLETDNNKPQDFETEYNVNHLKQLRDAVTLKRLEHTLYIDINEGFSETRQLIDKVRGSGKFDFIQRLLNLIGPYENRLGADQAYAYTFFSGRQEKDIGETTIAEKIFSDLLEKNKRKPSRRRGILNMLGAIKVKQGAWKVALELQNKCRKMVEKTDYSSIANVENQIGYIYRNLEDFGKENLKQAKMHYGLALNAARKIEAGSPEYSQEKNQDLIASILNNIGYVWGLSQNYRLAYQYCNDAIKIWSRENQNTKIALGEAAIGILERDQGNYDRSIRLLNSALSRDNLQPEVLCRTYFHLGWTQWFKAESQETADIDLLNSAAISLEESKKIAKEYEVNKELPGINHQLASVYWRVGRITNDVAKCTMARKLNEESYNLGVKFENIHYIIDSVVGMAEFDLDENDDRNMQKYFEILKPFRKFGFPLYFGRMERILGDFSYRANDLQTAFKKYSKGISQINLHGGFGPYSIFAELSALTEKVERLNKHEAQKWVKYLKSSWQKSQRKPTHADLIVWCDNNF